MMSVYTKQKKGFTLVETLVAISILSIAILGTFTAVQNSLHSSIFVKDQITAFYLVQEAVEYVRNIRDTNALQSIGTPGYNWLTYLVVNPDGSSGQCDYGKVCQIDVPNDTGTHTGIATCTGGVGSCSPLNQDPVSGQFGYVVGWTPTRFDREIQFQKINDNEVVVHVSITWVNGMLAKSFTVDQSLLNWY